MRSLTVLTMVLLLVVSAAADPLADGDKAANAGAYNLAEAAYREGLKDAKDPRQRQVLLQRLMQVSQLNYKVDQVAELSKLLRSMQLEPEVEMRLNLTDGLVAYRLGNIRRASQCYQRARALASKLGTPGAAAALFECDSFDYFLKLEREGKTSPADYLAAYNQAVGRLRPGQYWPMDILRASQWSQLWGFRAWLYSYYDHRNGVPREQNVWGTLSYQIFMAGMKAMTEGFQATSNIEYAYGGLKLSTDLAMDFCEESGTGSIIQANQAALAAMDKNAAAFPPGTFVQLELLRAAHLRGVGRYDLYNGRVSKGIEQLEQAAEAYAKLKDVLDEIDTLNEIAYQCFLVDFPVDDAVLDRVLKKSELANAKGHYMLGRFLSTGFQGYYAARKGDLARAETQLRKALGEVSTWVTESGASYRSKQEVLDRPEVKLFLNALTDVLVKQGKSAEAMDINAQISAQSQVSSIDLSRVKSKDPQVTASLRSIEEKRQEGEDIRAELRSAEARGDQAAVSQLQSRAASSKAEFYRAVNELRKREPEFERLITIKPANYAAIQGRLPENALLVQYVLGDKKARLFVATSKDLRIYESPMAPDGLRELVRRARRSLLEGNADSAALSELYAMLMAPMEADLAGKDLVIVVPSGPLYYLPFAALKGPQGFLVESKAVVTVTSSDLLSLGERPPGGTGSLLALANPDRSLPGAQKEVEQLAPLFPKRNAYYQDEATKSRLAPAMKPNVVHLATHGVLNSLDVNESYLVMAGPDSHLTNGDIYALDFNGVSLVTLSACQTNLGERDPMSGNDVATLAQAFSIAGCRSILASLWKVDDMATAELMVEFYRQLMAGKNKAQALREAELKLIKQGMTPSKWAAFELIGDWQ